MILATVVLERNSNNVMEGCDMIDVVIGILKNTDNKVLIACRPPNVVQPGLWEFPGGKVEPNETLAAALNREFQEEIGIQVIASTHFLSLEYQTDTRHLHLHSFEITTYQGEPYGRENQEVRWVSIDELSQYAFLQANAPIIASLRLNFAGSVG